MLKYVVISGLLFIASLLLMWRLIDDWILITMIFVGFVGIITTGISIGNLFGEILVRRPSND